MSLMHRGFLGAAFWQTVQVSAQAPGSCRGKRLGEACEVDAGRLAVAAQRQGVCASLQAPQGGPELVCLACGSYASMDFADRLGGELGARSVRRSGAKEVGSEVGSDEVSPGTMAQNTYGSEIPVWDGDPNSFERFASACQWYSYGLKDNERHLAAARVWNKMTGPAKGVVRHLSPEEFACSDGISKLLEVLRASPLQKLPIPDSFSRLEKWSNLGKRPHETIPQLIVREEELFTEVQASLKRAREMAKGMRGPEGLLKGKGKGGPTFATRTSTTPAQDTVDEDEQDKQEDTKIGSATGGSPGGRRARTLQQARQAVAKARAARGYYPLGGKDGGKSSGGKMNTSKGKALGPCFICGQLGHRFADCPRRSGKGAGHLMTKGPGKKGGKGKTQKGKGKGFAKPTHYFVSYALFPDEPKVTLADYHAVHVMSVGSFMTTSSTQVLVDTGATESACGIRSMDRLLRALGCRFKVTLNDRPSFKFGDGESLRAVSQVTFWTRALGELSFYLLDDVDITGAPPSTGHSAPSRRPRFENPAGCVELW
eukprot:s126_g10.t1